MLQDTESMAIRKYILAGHNLDVARNITFEEVSRKEDEYFMFEKTLYRVVDRFINSRISISDVAQYRMICFVIINNMKTIFCCNKNKHFLTLDHLRNDG